MVEETTTKNKKRNSLNLSVTLTRVIQYNIMNMSDQTNAVKSDIETRNHLVFIFLSFTFNLIVMNDLNIPISPHPCPSPYLHFAPCVQSGITFTVSWHS